MAPDKPERASFQTQMTDIPGVVHTCVADEMDKVDRFALHPGASPNDQDEPMDEATKHDLLFLAEDRSGPRQPFVGTVEQPVIPMEDITDFLAASASASRPFARFVEDLGERVNAGLEAGGWPHGDQKVLVIANMWKPYPDTPVERYGVEISIGWSYILARSAELSPEWFLAKISEASMRVSHAAAEDKVWAAFQLGALLETHNHRVYLPKVKKALKSISDARKGGQAKGIATRPRSRQIVDEMDNLITQGKPITEAARICATRKINPVGKNAKANEQLWHKVKRRERQQNSCLC